MKLIQIIEPILDSKRSVAYDSVHDKVEFNWTFNSTVISYVVIQFFLSFNTCFICDNTNSAWELLPGNEDENQMRLLKFGERK